MHQHTKRLACFIWLLGAGFFLAEYFARVALNVMVPELMQSLSVDALHIGALSACFYYAYLGMQLPVGMLVDRFGPHKLLTTTALLCALGCFLFAAADTLFVAKLGRFVMGFGAAFAFVGTLKLAKIWFPASRFGLLAGATQALGMLGAALGGGPMAVLVNATSWRTTMWIIGGVLVLLALLIGLFVRDKVPHHEADRLNIPVNTPQYTLLASLLMTLKNKQTWFNGLFAGMLYAPTAAFAELWGTSYIHTIYGIDRTLAAAGISMIFIGWAIGGPISGWISDVIGRRKPIMITSVLGSMAIMSIILYVPNLTIPMLFALLFCYGLFNIGVATAYAVASEINPTPVAGTAMAFTNMASVIFGALLHPLIGKLLVLKWDGVIIDNIPIYSPAAYKFAMLLLPLSFIISFIFALLVKETFCKNAVD